jgi:two-component system cell cycle sensor histidine kinase/response regulator CckA
MDEKPTYQELEKRIQQLEQAFQKGEEKYRILLDESSDPIFSFYPNGAYRFVNQAFAEGVGKSVNEIVGHSIWDIFPGEEGDKRFSVVKHVFATGKLKTIEVRVPRPEGDQYYITTAKAVKDNHGKVTSVICSSKNITDRKQTEETLRDSRKQLRLFIDSSPDLCFLKDSAAKYLLVNTANAQFFGKKEADIIGKTDFDLMPEEAAQACKETDSKAIEEKKMVISVENLGERVYETRKIPVITNDNVVGVAGIIRDITERRRTEEALRESEEKLARFKKMESLGLLAGGIAHDLNNVLSGIVSYPELLLMDLPQNSKLREPIETIQRSGHRAVAIVQDLLTVARGVATSKEPLNLNDIVSDYLNSPEFKKLEHFHPTVTVKTDLDTDLLNISGSHVHIGKVVMNLVSNASEAVDGGGHITISTVNRYIDKPLRGYDDVNIGEYVVLAVSDDGSGISSDDLERIFEPFYTKKVMGRSGTGLGLAVVWNVVQDHKGYIDVPSDENGTTFELYFPITRDEISGKDLSIPIKDYKGNGETILVVDDLESQRKISCKMLDTLGYKTKAVCSGEEAVEYLKENTVDLLLLDMIMDPGINGRETYERIIEILPNQKAIIISGFAETEDVKEAQKLGAGKYIKKPLTLERIGIAVKEELEKK